MSMNLLNKLEKQIEQYQKIIWMYNTNQEYVNPNCSKEEAERILERLNKEYYTNINIY